MTHGGKRQWRTPGAVDGEANRPEDAALKVLRSIDAEAKWLELLNCGNPRIEFDVMRYLTDRTFGKPTQQVDGNVDSEIVVRWLRDDEKA
jgi:hypothetical protein